MDKQLNLHLLSVAVTLYEERNVSAAAKKLGISQSMFSKELAKLRNILRDELFVKTGYGMIPTPRAHSLIEPARDALLRLKQEVLREPSFNPSTSKSTFTFAVTELGEMFMFPKVAQALHALAPQTSSRAVCPPATELIRGLEAGEIDLAIGVFPELEKNEFFKQRLLTIGTVCVMRADHPVRHNSLSRKEYERLGHVAVVARGAGHTLERLIKGQKLRRRLVFSTSYFSSLPMILQRSDVVATVGRPFGKYLCARNPNLKLVEPPFQIVQTQLQHWHARYQNDQKNRWIRQLVKKNFANENAMIEQ